MNRFIFFISTYLVISYYKNDMSRDDKSKTMLYLTEAVQLITLIRYIGL